MVLLIKPVWCLVILLSSFCLRKYTNTSTIFNFKEFLKVVIKFWKVHNPVAKGTVYASSMLYSRHKKSQVGHLTRSRNLQKCHETGKGSWLSSSLLHLCFRLFLLCILCAWLIPGTEVREWSLMPTEVHTGRQSVWHIHLSWVASDCCSLLGPTQHWWHSSGQVLLLTGHKIWGCLP